VAGHLGHLGHAEPGPAPTRDALQSTSRMKALVMTALVLLMAVTASSAQQSATEISRLDIELWKATLQVMQHDKRGLLALLNETLPAADIERALREQDRESSTLIDKGSEL